MLKMSFQGYILAILAPGQQNAENELPGLYFGNTILAPGDQNAQNELSDFANIWHQAATMLKLSFRVPIFAIYGQATRKLKMSIQGPILAIFGTSLPECSKGASRDIF